MSSRELRIELRIEVRRGAHAFVVTALEGQTVLEAVENSGIGGLAPESELRGLAPESELRGLAPESELRGLAPESEIRGLPFGCRYGACLNCAARLLSGHIAMPPGTALPAEAVRNNVFLPCVAEPRSDCVIEVGVGGMGVLAVRPWAGGG